jgi:hypothetical protein
VWCHPILSGLVVGDLAAATAFGLAGLLYIIVWIWSVKLVEEDAERRGWRSVTIGFIVAFTWPWGLVVYMIIARRLRRPTT